MVKKRKKNLLEFLPRIQLEVPLEWRNQLPMVSQQLKHRKAPISKRTKPLPTLGLQLAPGHLQNRLR
jgi:hypothetical protein